MTTSVDYWKQREDEQRKKNIVNEQEYAKEIDRYLDSAMDNVQREINSFYGKYATSEGITMAEAKKRVSKLDMDAYERKAKEYVKNKDLSEQANAEMKLYNATMKINRLELLKADIGLGLVDNFDDLQKYFDTILTDKTLAEFARQAGILGETILDNKRLVDSIVNGSFKNATFSDRIWMNQALLKSRLDQLLTVGLVQGRNSRVLARQIRDAFDVTKAEAERLMRTEMARVQTEAQKQSMLGNGIGEYVFLAEPTACPICAALHEKVFKVEDMMPGENASPMHPNCRCSAASHMDREEFDKWLDEQSLRNVHERGEKEDQPKKRTDLPNSVDLNYINSQEYRKRFDKITDDAELNKLLHGKAVDILTHRNNSDYEDMHWISMSNRKVAQSQTHSKKPLEVSYNKALREKSIKNGADYITIHNHPNGLPPSGGDFESNKRYDYKLGVVVGHDGSIYTYKAGKTGVSSRIIDMIIEKYSSAGYNGVDSHELALKQLEKDYGIEWRRL